MCCLDVIKISESQSKSDGMLDMRTVDLGRLLPPKLMAGSHWLLLASVQTAKASPKLRMTCRQQLSAVKQGHYLQGNGHRRCSPAQTQQRVLLLAAGPAADTTVISLCIHLRACHRQLTRLA